MPGEHSSARLGEVEAAALNSQPSCLGGLGVLHGAQLCRKGHSQPAQGGTLQLLFQHVLPWLEAGFGEDAQTHCSVFCHCWQALACVVSGTACLFRNLLDNKCAFLGRTSFARLSSRRCLLHPVDSSAFHLGTDVPPALWGQVFHTRLGQWEGRLLGRLCKKQSSVASLISVVSNRSTIWASKLPVGSSAVVFQGLCHFAVARPFQLFVKIVLGCFLNAVLTIVYVAGGGQITWE